MKREIAKIEGTSLGFEDHGILTAFLFVNYGVSAQGIGGFALKPIAGPYIEKVLGACGVRSWEALKGRTIFVVTDDNRRVVGIEPLPTEQGEPFMFADLELSGQPS